MSQTKQAVAPWEHPATVVAALDIACRVRDENPVDLCEQLVSLSADKLTDLAIVLAAMVDIDAPRSTVLRWTQTDFISRRTQDKGVCKQGHLIVGNNAVRGGYRENGEPRYLCRTCSVARQRARAERKRAAA